MARINHELLAFNRGVISPLALARVDVKRVALSAEEQTNWMPRVLGPMSLRPGLGYIASTRTDLFGNALTARYLPFIFSINDTALLEFTHFAMRVLVNDVVVTRPAVSTSVVNSGFDADLSGWVDNDEGVIPTSAWEARGQMSLVGDGALAAIRDQTVTIAVGDRNIEHAVHVWVTEGACTFSIGNLVGEDGYVAETVLTAGVHSLAFTPTGNFSIRLLNRSRTVCLITEVQVDAAGPLSITTVVAEGDISKIRYSPSGDVVFLASVGIRPQKVERRGARSWSVVDYYPTNGPFLAPNLTGITLTSSNITGNTVLTSSKPLFRVTNVGSLFRLTSSEQNVDTTFGTGGVFSEPVRVFGLTANRGVKINTTGTWVGTLRLQRAVAEPLNWLDVSTAEAYVTNQIDHLYNDGLDNQVIYYRLALKAADYTSGSINTTMYYANGSIVGIARVTGYNSTTSVSATILSAMGNITPTTDWAEGAWSARRGQPSAVSLHEGRLWWAGKDKVWGSVVDDFNNFDESYVGDAGPISRSIGAGPVDTIGWLVSAKMLVMGGQGAEFVCRSSSLEEPLTPTNFNIKSGTTQGSASVEPVKIDGSVIFVDRSMSRVHELTSESFSSTYAANELTAIVPEIGRPSIVRTAVQRKIDTRLHCVRSDGKVAILVFDKVEEVKCWVLFETDGAVEDVVVLPTSSEEDAVYYLVKRNINGQDRRYLEKWALTSEAEGGTVNKQADSFVYYNGAPTTNLVVNHLNGEIVSVWGDGRDLGTFNVVLGNIDIPTPVSQAVVGLTYRARFKSTKLAYAAQGGSALTQMKKLDHIGLILAKTHYQGLRYGDSYDYLDDLPLMENGVETAADFVWDSYDRDSIELNGSFNTDSRLCLEATSPRPCTVLAVVLSMSTLEKL